MIDDDPIPLVAQWLQDAQAKDPLEPTAMTLATVDEHARPSLRVVLCRGFDARGFVFYTNLQSRKGRELRARPIAALCFHWKPLQRQLRVEGAVEVVSDAEADAYFAARPRESQLGAWASRQSEAMPTEDALQVRLAEVTARFAGGPVPRPPHWSGFRVVPDIIELWQEGAFRLHTRDVYARQGAAWRRTRLFP